MNYYSTNNNVPPASLRTALLKGLADDNGLYMPEKIPAMGNDFFASLHDKTLQEISLSVASAIFGDDLSAADLRSIVYDTLSFDIPLVQVDEGIYSLELFHGPTMAFKDVGARFLARMMQHFTRGEQRQINVLVATSGDTGSAVANGFLGIDGISVTVLYPKGLVSKIQEAQFTTLGQNITALEVDGTFDDCQRLVKQAFLDKPLNAQRTLTSANSINLARFIPQAFYYFWGLAQMPREAKNIVVSVPCGNFGNLTAGLLAQRMGLPITHFLAANNSNNVFYDYLRTASFAPRASIATIANAMDVGNPSNFARIADLYNNDHTRIAADISGYYYYDAKIFDIMRRTYVDHAYILDPHGACAFEALRTYHHFHRDTVGFFLETAHPAKFNQIVNTALADSATRIAIPAKLQAFMSGQKRSIPMSSSYEDFRAWLLK